MSPLGKNGFPATMAEMKKLVSKQDGQLFHQWLELDQLRTVSAAFLRAAAYGDYFGRGVGHGPEYDALRAELQKGGVEL